MGFRAESMSALQSFEMELRDGVGRLFLEFTLDGRGGARKRSSTTSFGEVILGAPEWLCVDLSSFCTVALLPSTLVTNTASLEMFFVPSPLMCVI